LIDNIMQNVAPVTTEELKSYSDIEFDTQEFRNDIGTSQLMHLDDKVKTLMSRWRYPSLSLHGIQGAFAEPGFKTVIPKKVIAKFSIRVVPNQTPEEIEHITIAYLNKKWHENGSSNKFKVYVPEKHTGKCFLADVDDENYLACRKACKLIFGQEPDLIREGGSIPAPLSLRETTNKSVVLLPMGGFR